MRRPIDELTRMLDAARRLLLWPLQATMKLAGDGAGIRYRNLKSLVKGRAVRFGYDNDRRLFFATEGQHRHFFANWQRGEGLYSQGIEHRGRALWESYLLDHVKLDPDDVVVDCGANYGDL